MNSLSVDFWAISEGYCYRFQLDHYSRLKFVHLFRSVHQPHLVLMVEITEIWVDTKENFKITVRV